MPAYTSVVFALVVFTLGALPATAQDEKTVEVMPYVAVGTPGTSPVGGAVTFPMTSTLSIEADVAYRRGEGRLDFLSTNASLLYFVPRVGVATPYVAGGVGLAQFGAPVLSSSGPPIATQRRLATTVNTGGGVKMPINEKLNWRTDARWFKSIGGSEHFRVAHGLAFGVGKR